MYDPSKLCTITRLCHGFSPAPALQWWYWPLDKWTCGYVSLINRRSKNAGGSWLGLRGNKSLQWNTVECTLTDYRVIYSPLVLLLCYLLLPRLYIILAGLFYDSRPYLYWRHSFRTAEWGPQRCLSVWDNLDIWSALVLADNRFKMTIQTVDLKGSTHQSSHSAERVQTVKLWMGTCCAQVLIMLYLQYTPGALFTHSHIQAV